MGIRFRKSIKLGNLVKLNISKSGISATVGKGGASVNIGKQGVYANVNPSVAGVKGTGVSYRKKLLGNPLKSNKAIKETKEPIKEKATSNYEVIYNVHKTADNVLSKEEFSNLEGIDNLDLLIKGDEDSVENEIGIFLDNLDLEYPVSANYELEDNILYVDLDLPENEIFSSKGINLSKEEYSITVINLGIYLTMNFFNISSYIDEIVMSGFISKRNTDGELVDEYIYSIKFKREEFIKTDVKNLDDTYNFLLKFDNRINLSPNYSFKSIKPYTLISITSDDSIMDDVVSGLDRLGFKSRDISNILPELKKLSISTVEDNIKEALKLLKR